MLAAGQFDRLEEMARGYRGSKEMFPDGTWKLGEIYYGLEPDDAAPERAWQTAIATLERWMKARPESMTARVALANVMVAYGWRARGTGFRDSVSQEDFHLFTQRVWRAKELIEGAATLKEQCPYGHIAVMTAVRGIGGREQVFYGHLNDAIEANPGFAPAYEGPMIYLSPNWYGRKGASESYLQRYADKLGGEEGDVLYARLAWLMQASGMFSNAMKECQFSWDRVEAGFRVLEHRYPRALSVKSAHACLAGYAGGRENARFLIGRLEGRVDLSVWRPVEQFKEHVRWAYGQTTNATDVLTESPADRARRAESQ